MHVLGWERERRRLDGAWRDAFARGTAAERAVEINLEPDTHMVN